MPHILESLHLVAPLIALVFSVISAILLLSTRRRVKGYEAAADRFHEHVAAEWRELAFGNADVAEAWRGLGYDDRAAKHEETAKRYAQLVEDLDERRGR